MKMATTAAYSAVAPPRQVTHCDDDDYYYNDNDDNNSPQTTGIFAIAHSVPMKKYPKRKCEESPRRRNNINISSSHPPLHHNNNTLLIIVLATLLTTPLSPQQSFATAYQPLPSSLTTSSYYECGSMDIRNKCDSFAALENCTVITGFILIVLIPANQLCNYTAIRFPKLREITDFILVHEVKNFTTFKYMFPNLTVIRGRRLFLNYAIGITRMNQLATLEFPSLIAIQRGHVLVSSNQKLCSLDNISFDRLTLTPGQNHVAQPRNLVCPATPKCLGCDSGYCWSNRVCQKFENDNIVNLQQGIQHCDPQCLGGCFNRTAQGCAVCQSWTDHGTCVEKCDADKYISEHYMRCYTREECVSKRQFIYKKTCVDACPAGYKVNRITYECDSCGGINSCPKVCYSQYSSQIFVLNTLGDFENLRGCQFLNGSVVINAINRINDQELKGIFKDLREIIGYLRVEGSPYLTSLSFLENLQKIHGKVLDDKIYSIVLYNNRNLKELWSPKISLELLQGGMYIHSHDRLCNRIIKKFKNTIKHDNVLDSIPTSDQEILCAPAKLIVAVEELSHRSFKLVWPLDQTYEEVEIIHRPVTDGVPLTEQSDQETRVCERINWIRDLNLAVELQHNTSHYSYVVNQLNPHTKYASLIKTFGNDEDLEIRSEFVYATTHMDIPTPPMIKIPKKSFDSLTIQLYYENREDQFVDFYRMEIYELEDKKEILDQRNYCEDPINSYTSDDHRNEDYDTCCSHQLEEKEDAWFKRKLQQEFVCTLDQQQHCESNSLEDSANEDAILTKRLEHSETTYVVRSLKRFHRYVIQVQACNRKGCGSFNIISERTNFSLVADKLYDLSACKMPKDNEYRVHFKEPSKPNGLIAAYALHFRYFDSSSQGPYLSQTHCLSRLEHERQNYLYEAHLNDTYNQVAVRVDSLGHHLFTDWVDITKCTGGSRTTKMAGSATSGWNNFLIVVIIGGIVTLTSLCYIRGYWRRIPLCQRLIHTIFYQMVPAVDMPEDRQILTQAFEPTVHFQNTPEEEVQHQLVATTKQTRD